MIKTLYLFLLSISTLAQSSSIFPVPFNKQLNESQGIILGEYLGDNFKKDKDGRVITEASFKIVKSVGVDNRFLVNQNHLKIYYDGGIWQGLEYANPVAPRFTIGHNYVVLLKRTPFGFKPYMNKLGVYKFKETRDRQYIESLAFPRHKNIGKIPLKTFELWVRTVFGEDMSKRNRDKYVHKGTLRARDRAPASISRKPSSSSSGGIGIFWITVIFGVLGALRIRKNKKS